MAKRAKREISPVMIGAGIVVILLLAAFAVIRSPVLPIVPINSSYSQQVLPSQAIQNISKFDSAINLSSFYCGSASDCVVVHTSACFNNLASQQACISNSSYASYRQKYADYVATAGIICPQYLVSATASCACIHNACTLQYSQVPSSTKPAGSPPPSYP
ncbi:MAG: hypothetical protein KGH78_02330 [Candidatus Micrarchaeota archaeon]|nr:hypothetical protein [Candidatus Micrarchaeota archaeon]